MGENVGYYTDSTGKKYFKKCGCKNNDVAIIRGNYSGHKGQIYCNTKTIEGKVCGRYIKWASKSDINKFLYNKPKKFDYPKDIIIVDGSTAYENRMYEEETFQLSKNPKFLT